MELRALFGYEWGDEIGGPIAVTVPTGDTLVDLSCAYSVTTPSNRSGAKRPRNFLGTSAGYSPRRLLVRRRRGGHEKTRTLGFRDRGDRVGSDRQPFFTFHRSTVTGLRIELVSRVAQPRLQRCWTRPDTSADEFRTV